MDAEPERKPVSTRPVANPKPSDFLRLHWFDVGIILSAIICVYTLTTRLSEIALLLWLNLAALFVHQFEEYRFPGYFPGMTNSTFFSSKQPDRYPLNTNSAAAVNLGTGWLAYFLAALFNTQAIWLGITVTIITLGNVVIHAAVFNIRGRTFYNPGMASGVVLFLPISAYFYHLIIISNAASLPDWILGVILGGFLFYIGIDKLVDWLKDENTPFVFPQRCLAPSSRQSTNQNTIPAPLSNSARQPLVGAAVHHSAASYRRRQRAGLPLATRPCPAV